MIKVAKYVWILVLILAVGTGCSDDDGGGTEIVTISLMNVTQVGGVSGLTNTTGLELTFDGDPVGLTAANITVAGASKGALSGSGLTRVLAISAITVQDGWNVSVSIASPKGYSINGSPKMAVVYKAPAVIDMAAIQGIGVPVLGDTPVTNIADGMQYSGTVVWDGGWGWSPCFGGGKAYTATITLMPKPGYTLTGVPAGFFTVDGATNVTHAAGSGIITAVFPPTATVAVGDACLGGKVAYILTVADPGYRAGEQRGLIAATNDQGTAPWALPDWQTNAVPGGTQEAIGAGASNTDRIIAQNGEGAAYAAGLARAYRGGGYVDWYLPSRDGIQKLYLVKNILGIFKEKYYWASTEWKLNKEKAYLLHFTTGGGIYEFKSYISSLVLAVRSF